MDINFTKYIEEELIYRGFENIELIAEKDLTARATKSDETIFVSKVTFPYSFFRIYSTKTGVVLKEKFLDDALLVYDKVISKIRYKKPFKPFNQTAIEYELEKRGFKNIKSTVISFLTVHATKDDEIISINSVVEPNIHYTLHSKKIGSSIKGRSLNEVLFMYDDKILNRPTMNMKSFTQIVDELKDVIERAELEGLTEIEENLILDDFGNWLRNRRNSKSNINE